jgi:hypothetical protein
MVAGRHGGRGRLGALRWRRTERPTSNSRRTCGSFHGEAFSNWTPAKALAWLAVVTCAVALPLGLLLAFVPAGVAAAAAVNVTNCRDSGAGSLRNAVAGASSGERVEFALSCRLITETTGSITLATSLTIEGPGANTLAVNSEGAKPIFVVGRGVTATIVGLTMKNDAGGGISNSGTLTVTDSTLSGDGGESGAGGAIYNYLGTLTVRHSTLVDNGAHPGIDGGGIDSAGGAVTVVGTTLSGNGKHAQFGGGISINGGTLAVSGSTLSDNGSATTAGGGIVANGQVTVAGTMFSDNAANTGGGIFVNSGTLAVTKSTFTANSSSGGVNTGGGGGIYSNGVLTVRDSTFSGNRANDGGGGISNAGTLRLSDSTLSGNRSPGPTGGGGGVYNFGVTAIIIHSTLTDNVAPAGQGGGIFSRHGVVTVTASIVANSGAALDCRVTVGTLADGGYNLDDDRSCGFSDAHHSTSGTPAGLVQRLADNGGPTQTVTLASQSAAINHVTSASACAGNDQRGVTWPDPCDIGAIQSGTLAVVVPRISTIATSLVSPFAAFKPVKTVVVDAGITAGAVLLIAFPSQIFNDAFAANYDELRESWRRLFRRKEKQGRPDEPKHDWTTSRIVFGTVVLVSALLSSLNDPHFGTHVSSLVTYLGVVASIMVGVAIPGLVTRTYHRGRFGTAEASLHALPAGLAIAAGCVLVSRLTGFQPGYLYGVVVGLQFVRELKPQEKGHIVALNTVSGLVVAVAAWFAWVPVTHWAERPGAFVGLVLLDDLLAAIFVSGLVGTVFSLLPLEFMPGQTLKTWRRSVWAVLFAISVFGLIQVMIRPHGAHPHHAPTVVAIGLFVAFGVGSLAFRDYFERKHSRAKGEEVLPLFARLRHLVSFAPAVSLTTPGEVAGPPGLAESDSPT